MIPFQTSASNHLLFFPTLSNKDSAQGQLRVREGDNAKEVNRGDEVLLQAKFDVHRPVPPNQGQQHRDRYNRHRDEFTRITRFITQITRFTRITRTNKFTRIPVTPWILFNPPPLKGNKIIIFCPSQKHFYPKVSKFTSGCGDWGSYDPNGAAPKNQFWSENAFLVNKNLIWIFWAREETQSASS